MGPGRGTRTIPRKIELSGRASGKSPRLPKALILICWVALAACDDPAERCLAGAKVRTVSPSGRRVATVYSGGCPDVSLAPQVLVEFRTPQGRGGGGVFAVHDSAARIEARWLGDDTLEVDYPSGVTVEKRESTIRYRDQRLNVVYRQRPAE
jgi:hypothetical protein